MHAARIGGSGNSREIASFRMPSPRCSEGILENMANEYPHEQTDNTADKKPAHRDTSHREAASAPPNEPPLTGGQTPPNGAATHNGSGPPEPTETTHPPGPRHTPAACPRRAHRSIPAAASWGSPRQPCPKHRGTHPGHAARPAVVRCVPAASGRGRHLCTWPH